MLWVVESQTHRLFDDRLTLPAESLKRGCATQARAVVMNALVDALLPLRVKHTERRPRHRLWQSFEAASSRATIPQVSASLMRLCRVGSSRRCRIAWTGCGTATTGIAV
jgi:hypothetical protein